MFKFSCFSVLVGRKKCKDDETSNDARYKEGIGTLLVKLKEPVKPSPNEGLNSTSFSVSVPFGIQESPTCNVKVVANESPIGAVVEAANEGEDKHGKNSPTKTEFPGFDLLKKMTTEERETDPKMSRKLGSYNSIATEKNYQSDKGVEVELIQREQVTDPENEGQEFWTSPKLKRTCSNLESKGILKMVGYQFAPLKSHSFEDLQKLGNRGREEFVPEILGSPVSVLTHCSADRVMLKKHSSSQVLPSRSRRLWWKIFLWSHRNAHNSWNVKPRQSSVDHASDQKGGYSSDTLEPNQTMDLESRRFFIGESSSRINKKKEKSDGFDNGVSGLLPQNHWLAFSNESNSFTRVGEWVNSLETQNSLLLDEEDINDEHVVYPPSPETSGSPARSITHMTGRPSLKIPEEVLHAKSVIQSLNSASTVAHISVMGLKVIPSMSHFSNLRSINLSGNSIVHITAGSLPKGLHTLNLSRNKIVVIDGLRELNRLRILDLSYNRISRIGHGRLSNCIVIKELHLAGNKISSVEGLHRLLKLNVLDLSFNKITTTKGLSQLVAHYNTLLALNLLGNPIQSNISDDQLRKAVSELLPQLVYLNKQPIKPRRGPDAAKNSVTRAALGNNERTSRRRDSKRLGLGGSSSSGIHRNSVIAGGQKHGHGSRNSNHQTSPMKRSSSTLAFSSH
ncbi:Leucine-rich repeat [Macleaya cordata]|uniref:Leucine-rich repeat n=1 Tax=Macleaya cordata TaxID=56857 RepID=A0A200QUT6_MACCD|nr:Leucine-rich repeat [Macleaya cordata]